MESCFYEVIFCKIIFGELGVIYVWERGIVFMEIGLDFGEISEVVFVKIDKVFLIFFIKVLVFNGMGDFVE